MLVASRVSVPLVEHDVLNCGSHHWQQQERRVSDASMEVFWSLVGHFLASLQRSRNLLVDPKEQAPEGFRICTIGFQTAEFKILFWSTATEITTEIYDLFLQLNVQAMVQHLGLHKPFQFIWLLQFDTKPNRFSHASSWDFPAGVGDVLVLVGTS